MSAVLFFLSFLLSFNHSTKWTVKKKKKTINLSLTVLLTFSSFSLCALLHTWVLGDGRWGTKPHYPEKVLSPPSKETQKDHLGAMKRINKSLLLRARWLPLTQKMLRSNVLPKRVLLSDIARTSLSRQVASPKVRRMRAGFRARWSTHSHHTEPSLLSPSSPFMKSEWSSHSADPIRFPDSSLPPLKTWRGSGVDRLIPRKFLGLLSNSSSTGRQAGKQTTVIGVSASS